MNSARVCVRISELTSLWLCVCASVCKYASVCASVCVCLRVHVCACVHRHCQLAVSSHSRHTHTATHPRTPRLVLIPHNPYHPPPPLQYSPFPLMTLQSVINTVQLGKQQSSMFWSPKKKSEFRSQRFSASPHLIVCFAIARSKPCHLPTDLMTPLNTPPPSRSFRPSRIEENHL